MTGSTHATTRPCHERTGTAWQPCRLASAHEACDRESLVIVASLAAGTQRVVGVVAMRIKGLVRPFTGDSPKRGDSLDHETVVSACEEAMAVVHHTADCRSTASVPMTS